MALIWNNIKIKKGAGGVGDITVEGKNSIVSTAVSVWANMRLSQDQIAFGIATMGVESGFNPTAQALTTTAYGLGQFTDETWSEIILFLVEN